MKRQFLFAACTLFAASALLMTSCQQAEEPIANDPTDQAGPMTRAATHRATFTTTTTRTTPQFSQIRQPTLLRFKPRASR